ncbi:arginine--tRNA ligase [Candidatus Woesearchaeota archaeon]|nr:arginine--tRNA ligase [Candidatus Woesearchaeota archaeon]
MSVKNVLRKKICDYISNLTGKEIVESMVKSTPSVDLGDFAFPCFVLGGNPVDSSLDLKSKIEAEMPDFIEKVESKGPYLNFFLNRVNYSNSVLRESKNLSHISSKNKKVIIEYSQANTHKAFHVGHLRGTCLGESLARVLKFAGYDVTQVNYQGDTGIHVAKWIWCYKNFHSSEEIPVENREQWIASIYVDAVKRLKEGTPEEDTAGLDEVRKINQHIENRDDAEIVKFWQETRQWSLDAFELIYKDLGAHFDNYFFESEMESEAKAIVKELVDSNVAKIDDGASIIDLDDLGIWVLLRKDGTTLYSAKDLALAKRKKEMYSPDISVYVVGAAQSLHFRQLFETLKRIKFPNSDSLFHLAYAEVRLPTGKMSSRTGQNVLYSDMKEDVWNLAYGETKKRHEDWSEDRIRNVTQAIMIAALKFDMISKDSNKMIVFDPQKACEFEGETGPYLQYVCARINSLLNKAGNSSEFKVDSISDVDYRLLLLLDDFYDVVEDTADKQKIFLLCKYSVTLSKLFNEFYHSCNISNEEDLVLKNFRIALVEATKIVLGKSLDLLGIDVLEEM